MIQKKVKSIWNGKVGIHQKYIKEALDKNTGIEIKYNEEIMIIESWEIRHAIVGKSEKPFTNRFGGGQYYLYYFNWKPQIAQGNLF